MTSLLCIMSTYLDVTSIIVYEYLSGPGYVLPEVTEPCLPPSSDQPYGTRRKKKIMKIIDPNTGINVIEELTGHISASDTVSVGSESDVIILKLKFQF